MPIFSDITKLFLLATEIGDARSSPKTSNFDDITTKLLEFEKMVSFHHPRPFGLTMRVVSKAFRSIGESTSEKDANYALLLAEKAVGRLATLMAILKQGQVEFKDALNTLECLVVDIEDRIPNGDYYKSETCFKKEFEDIIKQNDDPAAFAYLEKPSSADHYHIALEYAVTNGRRKVVEHLLPKVDGDKKGDCFLSAIKTGSPSMVRLFLDDPDVSNHDEALGVSVHKAFPPIVTMLLEDGRADPVKVDCHAIYRTHGYERSDEYLTRIVGYTKICDDSCDMKMWETTKIIEQADLLRREQLIKENKWVVGESDYERWKPSETTQSVGLYHPGAKLAAEYHEKERQRRLELNRNNSSIGYSVYKRDAYGHLKNY